MLTAEEMTKRIDEREAGVLRDKMYPDETRESRAPKHSTVVASGSDKVSAMAVRIVQREVHGF